MTETFSTRALNRALLARQMLLAREDASVEDAVGRLAGLQAQQPKPPYAGLWTRLVDFEPGRLSAAVADGRIVRATWLRATLHLVTADDYRDFRMTVHPALRAAGEAILKTRKADVDLEATVAAARELLADGPLTFNEVRSALVERFPGSDDRALGYAVRTCLPLHVEPTGDRWAYGTDPAFRLAPDVDAEDRLEALVVRYLAAFGPAAPADFQTWSALKSTAPAFRTMRDRLAVFRTESGREVFDLPDAPRPDEDCPAPVRLLPAFDSAILAHKDRTRIIADEYRPRVTSKNLQVAATFLVDGFVRGIWKAERRGRRATLRIAPFERLPKTVHRELEAEAEPLLAMLEPDAVERSIAFD